ncbi:MAG: aminotransferase class IV, partial [Candidatus Moranbacteria bacterium]|nr:aminotransferase class IV [Candidatus Moranbacteria bacterium]
MAHCYFNGKITTLDKVKISPYDIGLLRGYAICDVMCTHNGKPFYTKEHWQRFVNSARELNLRVPITGKKFTEILSKLLKLSGFKKANLRTVLTGGINSDGGTIYEPGRETFYILVEKFQPLPKNLYANGAKVITYEHDRTFPRAKITNYIGAIKNQKKKEKAGATEIIFTHCGKALEASTSNFFIV